MPENVNRPPAMTVSKIINECVTTRAKPGCREEWIGNFMNIEQVD